MSQHTHTMPIFKDWEILFVCFRLLWKPQLTHKIISWPLRKQEKDVGGYTWPRNIYLFNFCNVLFYFWERQRESEQGRGRERGRHRIQSRLQALSCQHGAQSRAQTHKLWDHDLSWSRMLNPLGHPGAPHMNILIMISCGIKHIITITQGEYFLCKAFNPFLLERLLFMV